MILFLIFFVMIAALAFHVYTTIRNNKEQRRKLRVAKRACEMAEEEFRKSPTSSKARKTLIELRQNYSSLTGGNRSDKEVSGSPLTYGSTLGSLVMLFGVGLAVYSFNMDTTVRVSGVGRVANLDLQQKQMMTLIAGIALAVAGLVVMLFMLTREQMGKVDSKRTDPDT